MKKIFIIISFIALLNLTYFGAIFYAHNFNPNFLKIDKCLDDGGVWDDKTNICHKDSSDIKDIITKFYSSEYFKQGFGSIQTPYPDFSQDLTNTINQTIEKVNLSIKNTPKDEKPELIEGNVFVSLYEGATSVDVISININENIATVKILATYDLRKYGETNFKPISWNDEIRLKNENKLWKIDNIFYKGEENIRAGGEKSNLKSFLKNAFN